MAGNRSGELHKIWRSSLSLDTKVRLYKSLILSVLLYACETWVVLKQDEQRLEAFQNRHLKRIIGAGPEEHISTAELRERCKCPSLKSTVNKRRLKLWKRIETDKVGLMNSIFHWNPHAQKTCGGQRKTWAKQVTNTIEKYGETTATCAAMNDKEWKIFLENM